MWLSLQTSLKIYYVTVVMWLVAIALALIFKYYAAAIVTVFSLLITLRGTMRVRRLIAIAERTSSDHGHPGP